jgi:hypothetical protein
MVEPSCSPFRDEAHRIPEAIAAWTSHPGGRAWMNFRNGPRAFSRQLESLSRHGRACVPAIYVLIAAKDVDARDKRGHDGGRTSAESVL